MTKGLRSDLLSGDGMGLPGETGSLVLAQDQTQTRGNISRLCVVLLLESLHIQSDISFGKI